MPSDRRPRTPLNLGAMAQKDVSQDLTLANNTAATGLMSTQLSQEIVSDVKKFRLLFVQ